MDRSADTALLDVSTAHRETLLEPYSVILGVSYQKASCKHLFHCNFILGEKTGKRAN